jgi:hemolysin III
MEQGEKFNTYTHLAGALLALSGAILLLVKGVLGGDGWKIVSFAIYGGTLVLLYSISTIYHGAMRGRFKAFMQRVDHNSIYLLIAGSYTPFTLVSLRGGWGWSLFGVVWGLAALGMFQESFFPGKKRRLSMVIYILMGWVALVAVVPMVKVLSWAGFLWVAGGGLAYTAGIYFFLNDRKTYWHGIWHLFVIAGSVLHFIAIWFYVA